MASTLYWTGTATAVAQVGTVQITGNDAATTYILTVGSRTVSCAGSTNVNTTATALALAWNISTHPYFAAVTAVASTDTITFTGDVAGVPYTLVSSKSGGTGTIGAYTATVACSGPNHWDTAANWSTGVVPANTDTVFLKDSSVSICWGLAQSAVALAYLKINKNYTGKIGLDRNVFVTSSDGATTTANVPEYRAQALAIGVADLTLGENQSPSNPAGSGRINIDLGSTTTCICRILDTANSSADTGRPAIRFQGAKSAHKIYIEKAPGGVGFCTEIPGETGTFGEINVSDETGASKVYVGLGVTLTTFVQCSGQSIVKAAATITTMTIKGGTCTIRGDFTITNLNVYGGTVYANQIKTAGNCLTTATLYGGELNMSGSNEPRTIATLTMKPGSTFACDGAYVTVTAFTQYAGGNSITMNSEN